MQSSSPLNFSQAVSSIQNLISKSKPETSTTMKSAVVALFTGEFGGQLEYTNCIGLLELDYDRQLKAHMLRFYNMQTVSLVFEIELYYEFIKCYQMLSSTLYVFEYPFGGNIAFLFKNKEDADIMKIKITSASPKQQQFDQIKKQKMEQKKRMKQENSMLNKFMNLFQNDSQKVIKKSGEVLSVKKDLTIDLNTGNIITDKKDLSPEWVELLNNLKLSKNDLKDKQIMNIIAEDTIIQQAKIQAVKNHDKNLQQKIRQAEDQEKQYIQNFKQRLASNLPPPPPPPPLLLQPPQLSQNRASFATKRGNLLQQIRNNHLKLKHVQKVNQCMNLDISNMNKEERMDHAARLREKLQMRKQALNRRQASDDEDY